MPSGPKKRKSSKKPKAQGEPTELEAGLEEVMPNDGEVVGEATLSSKGFEGDPEAMAGSGLEGIDEADVELKKPKDDFQTDEATPDQGVTSQGDQPMIPAAIKAEAPAVIELEGENGQRETESPSDTPRMESDGNNDATPEEIKPELESDAVPLESPDATPDASPGVIKLDAEIGVNEIESSKESTKLEREFERDAALFSCESRKDESLVETETKTDAASTDIEPDICKSSDEMDMAAALAEGKLEIPEPSVRMKPGDTAPCSELEVNETSVEVELETDGTPAEIKPEEAQVGKPDKATPTEKEPKSEEVPEDRQLVTDAAPPDVETSVDETQVEELESAASADIETETAEAPMGREVMTDAAPTSVAAAVEEALVERELAQDAATADVEPETDAAPLKIKAETEIVPVETDTLQDDVPPEIDAASPEKETDSDVAVREFESQPHASVIPTDVGLKPEVNLIPDNTEEGGMSGGEFETAPEPEPLVQALGEGDSQVNTEYADESSEIEAKRELPQETEQELKTLELAEDTSLEPPQEIEPESESTAIDEAKTEDEVGMKANDKSSVEIESDQRDTVEEIKAPLEINPESELETTHGIELEVESEVPLEAEPKSVVEALSEGGPDEKGIIDMQVDHQDLVESEPYQSVIMEHDQQLQTQEVEAESSELDSSVCEENQPVKVQRQFESALEVPAIEDELLVIPASVAAPPIDDSSSSTASSELSDSIDEERTPIEHASQEGYNVPTQATALEGNGKSIVEFVAESPDIEQTRSTAVDIDRVASYQLPTESKEDIIKEQERAIDGEHDEVGTVVASGIGGVTAESSETELGTPIDVVDLEESTKGAIDEQDRPIDGGHSDDDAVLPSAGNGSQEIPDEQELGIEERLADVVDVEELAKNDSRPSDELLVTGQTQRLIDEQDPSMGIAEAVDEPPSFVSEKGLSATSPCFESEAPSEAPESHDEAVTQANEGNVPSEHDYNPESATGDKDIPEEEASSTVAEVGSVLNDFDERAACAQEELPTEFSTSEQDVDIPDSKELDVTLSTEAPETVETGLHKELDIEASSTEKVDANPVCGVETTSELPEVLVEGAGAAKPADLHSVHVEEMPSNDQVNVLPQPEQVAQDSRKDDVEASKVDMLASEEPRTVEEEGAACEDAKVATSSMDGALFPNVTGDELISKATKYLDNGKLSSETSSKGLVEQPDDSSVLQTEANNSCKAEIHTMDSNGLKEAEHDSMGVDSNDDANNALAESASLISDARDIKGVQTFWQESTREASLPVVISTQNRALERVDLQNTEQQSGGGPLQRRTKLLDCCGMFDLLLRKN